MYSIIKIDDSWLQLSLKQTFKVIFNVLFKKKNDSSSYNYLNLKKIYANLYLVIIIISVILYLSICIVFYIRFKL